MTAEIIPFCRPGMRAEITVAEIKPGEWCVDLWSKYGDSCAMLARGLPDQTQAIWRACYLSQKHGARLVVSEEAYQIALIAWDACGRPPFDGGDAA